MTILDSILNHKKPASPSTTGTTKVASAPPAPSSVDQALDRVLDNVKTASAEPTPAADPITALEKLASDQAQQDVENRLKLAQLEGRAYGAGFIAELNEYAQAAQKVASEKLAAVSEDDLALIKMARENPQAFLLHLQQMAATQDKTAAEQQAALEKWAKEDPASYEAAVRAGYVKTAEALNAATEEGFRQGYNDTITDAVKVAALHYAMGFDAMNEALAAQK